MTSSLTDAKRYVIFIRKNRLNLYDKITIGDQDLWIPDYELQTLLDNGLQGLSLAGLPLRTRSKVVKARTCEILGYPIPRTFKKTRPQFPGQMFDIYTQKSNNLQIWNDDIDPSRRYVIIHISDLDVITNVRVIRGNTLAELDTTGTLTRKYQAHCILGNSSTELIVSTDTDRLLPSVTQDVDLSRVISPVLPPKSGEILAIDKIFERLVPLVGKRFIDAGADQERNRGATLHRLVCEALGYPIYQDSGQFPDVRHQLLEVKLQTSPTIDLGYITPDSTAPLDVPIISNKQIRHCDVRYGIFYGKVVEGMVGVTHFFLTTGQNFFSRFPRFQGNIVNAKRQIPLPNNFFNI